MLFMAIYLLWFQSTTFLVNTESWWCIWASPFNQESKLLRFQSKSTCFWWRITEIFDNFCQIICLNIDSFHATLLSFLLRSTGFSLHCKDITIYLFKTNLTPSSWKGINLFLRVFSMGDKSTVLGSMKVSLKICKEKIYHLFLYLGHGKKKQQMQLLV